MTTILMKVKGIYVSASENGMVTVSSDAYDDKGSRYALSYETAVESAPRIGESIKVVVSRV